MKARLLVVALELEWFEAGTNADPDAVAAGRVRVTARNATHEHTWHARHSSEAPIIGDWVDVEIGPAA